VDYQVRPTLSDLACPAEPSKSYGFAATCKLNFASRAWFRCRTCITILANVPLHFVTRSSSFCQTAISMVSL
jgi:hypothetical protein